MTSELFVPTIQQYLQCPWKAVAYCTATVSYAGGANYTRITFDTVMEDPSGGFDQGNFQWVAPHPGHYLVTAVATGNGTVVCQFAVAIYKNGAIYQAGENVIVGATGIVFPQSQVVGMVPLALGDNVQIFSNSNSSATSSSATGIARFYLGIHWMSPH